MFPLPLFGSTWTSAISSAPTGTIGGDTPIGIVWMDTPDWYTTALMSRYWTPGTVHADAQVVSSEGYGGGSAWNGVSEAAYAIAYPRDLADTAHFGFGYRMKITGLPAAEKILLAAVDTSGAIQVCVTLRTDQLLSIWAGNMVTELKRSTAVIPLFSQLRFGFRGTVDGANGSAEVYVNGVLYAQVDSVATGTSWAGLYLGLAPTLYQSHAYAGCGTGVLRPGLLVNVGRPAADGITNEWLYSGGSTFVDSIDDTTADGGSTYGYASASDQQYSVTRGTLSTRVVYGVRSIATVRNVSGSHGYKPIVVQSTGESSIAAAREIVTTDWRMVDRFDAVQPLTGAAWTDADVNDCSFGGQVS